MTEHQIELWAQIGKLFLKATENTVAYSSTPLDIPMFITKKIQVQNKDGVPIDYIILGKDELYELLELIKKIALND